MRPGIVVLMSILVSGYCVTGFPMYPGVGVGTGAWNSHPTPQLKELLVGLEVAESVTKRFTGRFLMPSTDSRRDGFLLETLINIQNLMRHKAALQEVGVKDSESEMGIGLEALDFVLTQVITDGCNWVYDYLDREMIGDFDCNLGNVTNLVSIIFAQKTVEDALSLLKTYVGGLDGVDTCKWIICNIICDPDISGKSNIESIMRHLLYNNAQPCPAMTVNDIGSTCKACPSILSRF